MIQTNDLQDRPPIVYRWPVWITNVNLAPAEIMYSDYPEHLAIAEPREENESESDESDAVDDDIPELLCVSDDDEIPELVANADQASTSLTKNLNDHQDVESPVGDWFDVPSLGAGGHHQEVCGNAYYLCWFLTSSLCKLHLLALTTLQGEAQNVVQDVEGEGEQGVILIDVSD